MSKILFAVQLPPPVHGSSMVNKTLFESKEVKLRFELDLLEIQLASNMEGLGGFSVNKVLSGLKVTLRLLKKLFTNKYELAYFTLSPVGFAFLKDFILVTVIKLRGIKVVFHLHGKGIENELNSFIKKKLYKFIFKNVDVILLSGSLVKDIAKVVDGDIYILNNGVLETPTPKVIKTFKKVKFTYLSNLMYEKGIMVFLNAIKSLKDQEDLFEVNIIGPSADVSLEEVQAFLNNNKLNNVNVTGALYGKEKHRYLESSDVFVLPTFYKNECFPLSILEAFQAGNTVISTTEGAIPEIVEDGKNGIILQEVTPNELSKKMIFLIKNPKTLKIMQEEALHKFKERYTLDIFLTNFIEIMESILKK